MSEYSHRILKYCYRSPYGRRCNVLARVWAIPVFFLDKALHYEPDCVDDSRPIQVPLCHLTLSFFSIMKLHFCYHSLPPVNTAHAIFFCCLINLWHLKYNALYLILLEIKTCLLTDVNWLAWVRTKFLMFFGQADAVVYTTDFTLESARLTPLPPVCRIISIIPIWNMSNANDISYSVYRFLGAVTDVHIREQTW